MKTTADLNARPRTVGVRSESRYQHRPSRRPRETGLVDGGVESHDVGGSGRGKRRPRVAHPGGVADRMKPKQRVSNRRRPNVMMEVLQSVTTALGPRACGIYLVVEPDADSATLRRFLRKAHAVVDDLVDRLIVAERHEEACARLRTKR